MRAHALVTAFAVAVSLMTVAALGGLPSPAIAAQPHGAAATTAKPAQPDRYVTLPKTPAQPRHLARMGAPGAVSTARTRAIAVAASQAATSGKPVVVGALTTPTTTVMAKPDDELKLIEHLFPVRVWRGHAWVPVSTRLRRDRAGSLSPVAVPGDAVRFSGGGSGPLATISAAKTALSLGWPGRLPAPRVSAGTATYRNVLPGVDLVLTATSAQTGGFSEVLVVHTARAAASPRLARLNLAVEARGVRLTTASGGGLVAAAPGLAGYYTAAAPEMWDSSHPASPGPSSSAQGPGGGARLARIAVRVSGNGRALSLLPDHAMLTSRSTKWPVYIDPSFEWVPADGGFQAFIPVQSDCPTAKNYNNTSSYPATPVGFDNFGGTCSVNSTDYSYFRVTVPSAIWGSHLNSATIKANEAYSSDCTSSANVTLSWSGNFNANTTWNSRPADLADLSTVSVGPDKSSCGGTVDFGATVGVSFNVMSAMTKATTGDWSAFAFRVWEQGSPGENVHKQFSDHGSAAPFLQLEYNYTPQVPDSEKATANSDGSQSAGCDTTSTSPPTIGAISNSGPYLWAHFLDKDGDEVDGTFRYWKYPATTPAYLTLPPETDLAKAGATVAEAIPASFYAGLANGQVIAWDAQATDGHFTSAWSPTCYFSAWPTAPAAPSISAPVAGSNCPGGVVSAGCQVTFTLTAASNDPATEFVWALDQLPLTSSPPATEIVAASGSPPTATLTITVPSPGPHNLWVYASDAGANDSGETNGNPGSSGATTFTAAGDPAVSCASFGSALAGTCSGPSSPNTIISRLAANPQLSCGGTTGDGTGTDLDATDLAKAGWQPGGMVTIDGANFALPQFGTCGADNVLAAGQTIAMGNATGGAVEFLATSTDASTTTTGLTGADDSGPLAGDDTSPGVPGGIAVTGGGCDIKNDVNVAGCQPASGTITYAAGCAVGSSTYDLTVPDWVAGPSDIAAMEIGQRDLANGTTSADEPKIYAFAAPAVPGCQIASVTLPDVGDTVSVPLQAPSADIYNPPALHILGLAVRNTTTATPVAGGGTSGAPAGQSWAAGWAGPIELGAGPTSGSWGNQTLRIGTKVATGGSQVRIRLSDPGFLASDGDGPLMIGHATIAVESPAGGPVTSGAPVPLTFGGHASTTVPEGGDLYSDPLSFPVTAGQNLLISLYLSNPPGSLPVLPEHSWNDSSTWMWVSAAGASGASGDYTTDMSGNPFGSAAGGWWTINTTILAGLDVTGTVPTVAVLGDNLADVNYNAFASKAVSFPVTRLAGLLAPGQAGSFAVVDAGISSNEVDADSAVSSGLGGVSAIARLDRDVLAEPGIGTVIVDEGLQDVLHGAADQPLEDAYETLQNELNAFGITVILTTMTPCGGYTGSAGDTCSAAVDGVRTDVNGNLGNTTIPNCYADLDAAVTNGASQEALQSADDAGDHLNLTQAGYTTISSAVQGCSFAANAMLP